MSGLMIDHDAWVMVGDGEKALFFRNEGDAPYPNLEVVDVLEHENPKTREQGTDRPGRAFASVGTHRSAHGRNQLAQAGESIASPRKSPMRSTRRPIADDIPNWSSRRRP